MNQILNVILLIVGLFMIIRALYLISNKNYSTNSYETTVVNRLIVQGVLS